MIQQSEFQARRQKLASLLPGGSIALFASAKEVLRNGDAHYRFRQDSNFYYLTGFNEPEAVLLIAAGKEGTSYLFNRPRDPAKEQWTGRFLGQKDACEHLGMADAFPIEEFEKRLPDFLANKEALYYSFGRGGSLETAILNALRIVKKQIRQGVRAPQVLQDIDPIVGEMRLLKSEAEIALMRKVTNISVAAHKAAFKACRRLKYEYELEAEIVYALKREGCQNMAYDPIVGSGANACTLHYTDNNQALTAGDLVLIDAAGELHNYAADISRTFPVNGRFTDAQASIYELVLKAQKAGIACIKPGVPWSLIQETMVSILTAGLLDLGILRGKVEDLLATSAYKPYYMHNSGHWLGLDVHDVGSYKIQDAWRSLQAGMVLTVEPGLYLSPSPTLDKRWWNIGVRIEDDILVTQDGYENLSQDLPVELADIEAYLDRG